MTESFRFFDGAVGVVVPLFQVAKKLRDLLRGLQQANRLSTCVRLSQAAYERASTGAH